MTDSQSYKKRVNDVSGHMLVVYEKIIRPWKRGDVGTSSKEREREREREETLPLGRTGWEVVGVVPVPLPSQQIT
jgi:hypothetical protein